MLEGEQHRGLTQTSFWVARPVLFYKTMFPTVALEIVTESKGGAEKVQLFYTVSGFVCWGSW